MVHVVLVPTVHCCNKVVLNRPCCVFALWLFSAKLVYKILQARDLTEAIVGQFSFANN